MDIDSKYFQQVARSYFSRTVNVLKGYTDCCKMTIKQRNIYMLSSSLLLQPTTEIFLVWEYKAFINTLDVVYIFLHSLYKSDGELHQTSSDCVFIIHGFWCKVSN